MTSGVVTPPVIKGKTLIDKIEQMSEEAELRNLWEKKTMPRTVLTGLEIVKCISVPRLDQSFPRRPLRGRPSTRIGLPLKIKSNRVKKVTRGVEQGSSSYCSNNKLILRRTDIKTLEH